MSSTLERLLAMDIEHAVQERWGTQMLSCVEQSVPSKVAATDPRLVAERQRDLSKHIKMKTWDPSSVVEYKDVLRKADSEGMKAHAGRIPSINLLKHSESGSPVAKSRAAFEASRVRDGNGGDAIVLITSSVPASIESCRSALARGAYRGHATQAADGDAACLQVSQRARKMNIPRLFRLPRQLLSPDAENARHTVVKS